MISLRKLFSKLPSPTRSLSTKLSLVILLLAAPIFSISLGVLFTQSRYLIRKEALGRANSVLNTTMQRMYRYITAIETATNANKQYITEHMDPDSLLALTRYIVSLNPNIDGCSVSLEPNTFPEYGEYFSVYTIRERRQTTESFVPSSNPAGTDTIISAVEQPYDYFKKIWYKTPRDKNAPCWVDYFDDADLLEVVLSGMLASYGMPIHDADGRLVGVISADISLKRISKALSMVKPYPNSYLIMVDTEGHYVVHPDSSQLFTHSIFDGADPRHQPDIIALGHEMTKRNEGSIFLDFEGKHCLVCYKPVPGIAWSLALVCPVSDILEGYDKLTHILVPLLIIGLVLILLLCHHAVAHSIRPLNVLLDKTQTIASGNMEVYIPRSERLDAIGKLQNSFASMLQRLNFQMGSVRYTTERAQQRYEELAEATRLAEEADRQKTIFIQNVSHQIRTPLNIILGFSQILSNADFSAIPKEEMKSIISTIDHNSKLLTRIVLMLYDSSDTGFCEELNSHKIDKVGCNSAARDVITYMSHHYPDLKIAFHTDVPDDICIQTNQLYLLRSLRELLYNSAKFSDGQHVSLNVTLGQKSSGTSEPQQVVRFIVEDTGKGITGVMLDKMFSFFAKEDDLSEGLGLGLPLARRHILNLGGELTMDPDYHDGCRFIIELPV